MTPLLATLTDAEKLQAGILAAFQSVSAGLLIWVYLRARRRDPVIPLARRRPAPWQGQDVLFIFFMGWLLLLTASAIVQVWMGGDAPRQAAEQKPDLAHPAEQLLRSDSPGGIAVTMIMAIIVAPLIEEFIFRVLLQGWLEAIWSRERRKHEALRRAPLSWIPILAPALLFATMHARSGEAPATTEYLTSMFVAQSVAELATLGLAIALLRYAVGATSADLGWNPAKLGCDVKYGLVALLMITPPVLTLHVDLLELFSSRGIHSAPDPIPLFFLALVLGYLYRRTHRIAPSLVLHMAFNATSVGLLFAGK